MLLIGIKISTFCTIKAKWKEDGTRFNTNLHLQKKKSKETEKLNMKYADNHTPAHAQLRTSGTQQRERMWIHGRIQHVNYVKKLLPFYVIGLFFPSFFAHKRRNNTNTSGWNTEKRDIVRSFVFFYKWKSKENKIRNGDGRDRTITHGK